MSPACRVERGDVQLSPRGCREWWRCCRTFNSLSLQSLAFDPVGTHRTYVDVELNACHCCTMHALINPGLSEFMSKHSVQSRHKKSPAILSERLPLQDSSMDATVSALSSFTIEFRVKLSSARLVLLRGEKKTRYCLVPNGPLFGCLFQSSHRVIIIRIVVCPVII